MTETFDQWELSARIALGDQGIDYHAATPPIEAARAHCEATGQSPREAFGTPEEFAATTADELPAGLRAEVDYLTGQLFTLATLVLIASVFFAVLERTMSFPVTPAILAGLALLAAALMASGGLPGALRAAGRPRQAKLAYVAAGVLGLLSATAFTTLPHGQIARVPVLGLVAISVVALGLLTRAPKPRTRRPRQPRGTDGDPDAWLTRLSGLLVGRYDLPPERAADLVREARAHLAATGAAPQDEFGSPADYARRVAEPEPVRRDPWWRTPPVAMLAWGLAIAAGVDTFIDWSAGGHVWSAWLVAVPATAFSAGQLIRTARTYRRAKRVA
jgi:hypothetical protein